MSSRKGVFSPGEKGPLAPSQAGFWSSSGIFSRFCLQEPMVNAYFIETVSRSHNTSHSKSCVGLRVRRYPYPVPSPGERGVMRFLLSRQQARLVIGAVMPLLIQGSFAPWSAWARMQPPRSFEWSETRGICQPRRADHRPDLDGDRKRPGRRPGDSSQTLTSPALLRAIVLGPRPVTCLRKRGGCCRSRPVGRALGLIRPGPLARHDGMG